MGKNKWTLPMDDEEIEELLKGNLLTKINLDDFCTLLDDLWEKEGLHGGEGIIVLIQYIRVRVLAIGVQNAEQPQNEELFATDIELVFQIQELISRALWLAFDKNQEFLSSKQETIH